ncbi:DEAD/DEAH box helicase [Azospirillum isscasi]|uniref:DEAD/DEAH box helicase n=1 Tax=Azospirillum isscasi TaxID=3053926 RepID=A0ABU0WN55_9PROT|nr:DEAD/DEAH box helicase [Azospirillum isscasi]MDQ2105661.1 DEAD/DEAH box helicase [Azospirillum isscasi]
MPDAPLAHSAPGPGRAPHPYPDHIGGARAGALRCADAMLLHQPDAGLKAEIRAAVGDAVLFHDLGKLDPQTQAALRRGRDAKLPWDHIDAGVAHLSSCKAMTAAWVVRGHHAPGLPSRPHHFTSPKDRKLRGRRHDDARPDTHRAQIDRTNGGLPALLALHEALLGPHRPTPGKALRGLRLRLALSCVVDGDHGDSAGFTRGWAPPQPPEPRWEERLTKLDAYVKKLGGAGGQRDGLRRAFYDACRSSDLDEPLVACEGPVGIGKTTAVTAWLLRRAIATGARRLLVVAPQTTILAQTAETLRKALVLDGERPDAVVAEHHHRADFDHISARDLATLWSAPIILTTSVQFFETLSSNRPSVLRKLHALPGSVVFLDEAHAMLPVSGTRTRASGRGTERVATAILPQNWRWIGELAREWSCSFVLASGSLARFWEFEGIADGTCPPLPDLVPATLTEPLRQAEADRVRYVRAGRFSGPAALADAVAAQPGPRLLIMNTVQSAAVMAWHMRKAGDDVLHLSTALCPRDRTAILAEIQRRLSPESAYPTKWTLVGTSLLEAGLDLSFRTAFRERFGTASLIQVGGRVNRDGEWSDGGTVHDFLVSPTDGLTAHPEARASSEVLGRLFESGTLDGSLAPADLVTRAMRRELRSGGGPLPDHLGQAEKSMNYPDVTSLGRVIDTETELVVVDPVLAGRIAAGASPPATDVLAGSVQIHSARIDRLGLLEISGRRGIYHWPHGYDPAFLGYMDGLLPISDDDP